MLNVITTTKTGTHDAGEYTITTYTVGGYALVRTESGRGRDMWTVRAPHELPCIFDTSDYMADVRVFGVNWSACGTQSTTDARAYAALLATAADVADVFTSIAAAN